MVAAYWAGEFGAGTNWLGKKVSFTLLGQRVVGRVIEVLHEVCTCRWLIVEFRDRTKQVKVGAPYQAFLIEED